MELLLDPTVLSVAKIVGGAIAIALAVPFVIGAVLGFLVGRAV